MIVELEEGVGLEPCPFCGARAVLKTDMKQAVGTLSERPTHFWVKCENRQCGVSPAANLDQRVVISAWNQRQRV